LGKGGFRGISGGYFKPPLPRFFKGGIKNRSLKCPSNYEVSPYLAVRAGFSLIKMERWKTTKSKLKTRNQQLGDPITG
jgi:hypothetical protein